MSKRLLLEIGTEEVPAHVMPGILRQLKENAAKALHEVRLAHGEVITLGTPRRIALAVEDLAERQPDSVRENRGPAVNIAFDGEGNPTKAAQGFARGQKISPADLVVKDGYVYAKVEEKGRSAEEILGELLPSLITGLNFPNSMRWGSLDFKFIRPIRWLVALYGDNVIEFDLAGVKSDRISRGQRTLAPEDFTLESAAEYEEVLAKHFVIVNQEKRKDLIRRQIEETAKTQGGTAEITPDLLEEVLYLVEYPTALYGRFEERYLELPAEAVITPMRDHQRYFPVKDKVGRLMPLFITVRNGGQEYLDTVRQGNERVLKARLEDARFFFNEDRKKTLEEHREKLKTVVFQDGLGTVYEKSERLMKLAEFLAASLGINEEDKNDAIRAARLAKADLVTGMVTEFTELQGVMGREYAKLDGEREAVAIAIDEHYKPRYAGDSQPQTTPGRLLSLADKIDNIVGTFSRGKIPTGSQDPFALRRQALGLTNMLTEAGWSLSLSAVVNMSLDLYGIKDNTQRDKMQRDVADFIKLRLKNLLETEKIRYDVADAVLTAVDDPYIVLLRAKAVNAFVTTEEAALCIQAWVRVANIAAKAKSSEFKADEFTEEAEKQLSAAYGKAAAACNRAVLAGDYAQAIEALTELSSPIVDFFNAVMVMDKDEKVRCNRLGLLKAIDELTKQTADFGQIVL